MIGNSRTVAAFRADEVGYGSSESFAEKRWAEMVKNCMAETGKSQRHAEYAVALTPEGQRVWEEVRKAALKRG